MKKTFLITLATLITVAAFGGYSGAGISQTEGDARWKVSVNVKQFGAVGDGVTDDTSAIQSAVDSLGGTGGTVFVPKGVYRLSPRDSTRPVLATTEKWSIELGSNIRFVGEPGTIFKPMDSATNDMPCIHVNTNNSNVYISHIEIDGNKSRTVYGQAEDEGIDVKEGCSNIYIDHVIVYDCGQDGIDIDGSENIHISNAYVTNCNKNGIHLAGSGPVDVYVTDSYFEGNGIDYPIAAAGIDTTGGCDNIRITKCTFVDNSRALNINIGSNFHVKDCNMSASSTNELVTVLGTDQGSEMRSSIRGSTLSNTGAGIVLTNNLNKLSISENFFQCGPAIVLTDGTSDVLISGNLFRQNSASTEKDLIVVPTTDSLDVSNGECFITGNSFSSAGFHALKTYDGPITFSGNKVDCGSAGVRGYAESSGSIVANNHFESGIIQFSNGATGVVIKDNTLDYTAGTITLNNSDDGFVQGNLAYRLYLLSGPSGNTISGNDFSVIETTTSADVNNFYWNHCGTLTLGNPVITNSCEFYFNTGALFEHND